MIDTNICLKGFAGSGVMTYAEAQELGQCLADKVLPLKFAWITALQGIDRIVVQVSIEELRPGESLHLNTEDLESKLTAVGAKLN